MVNRTISHFPIRLLAHLLLLFLALLLAVPAAQAHGGGTVQLVTVPTGPYLVSAWTAPDPVRAGELHVTIAVSEMTDDASAGPPVLGAAVDVELVAQDGSDTRLQSQATNEAAANKLYYETDMEVPHEGPWQVLIAVTGPEGSGQTSFDLEVLPPRAMNWTLVGALGAAVVAITFVATTLRGRQAKS